MSAKILIGSQVFSWQRFGGISRYIVRLAANLAEMPGLDVTLLTGVHRNIYASLRQPEALRQIGWAQGANGLFPKRGAVNAALDQLWVNLTRPDIYHASFFVPLPRLPGNTKLVVTVYDCLHELFPDEEDPTGKHAAVKPPALVKADHIIAISETTRRDVMSIHGVPPEKITTVHLAAEETIPPGPRPVPERYVLYVGNRAPHKGFPLLFESFAAVAKRFPQTVLLLGGGSVVSAKEEETLARLGIRQSVKHLPMDEQQLAWAYQHAECVVVPSVYEGFGLPVVEAMSYGIPVICSDGGSLPEVAGGAALIFPVGDTGALTEHLVDLLESKEERIRLRRLGLARAKEFSWAKCALETLAVYEKLLKSQSV